MGLILGLGTFPGVGNGTPLQCSHLENSMDRGAWQATVHEITKSQTWQMLSLQTFINWIIFLISFSDYSLLVYRSTANLSILILHPETLLDFLISSSNFFVDSLGSSVENIFSPISFSNRDNFISSFPVWVTFISFSCLIAVAETSNTMLNRSGENSHPYFSLDRREEFSVFHFDYDVSSGFA